MRIDREMASYLLLETVAIQIVTASSEAFSYVIHLGRQRQFSSGRGPFSLSLQICLTLSMGGKTRPTGFPNQR